MAMAIPSLVGAAVGAVGHNQKMGQYNRDKELAARMESNSPWTGVHGEMPKQAPSLMGEVMQGGMSGLSMGQNIGKAGGIGGFLGGAEKAAAPIAQGANSPMGSLWAGQDAKKPGMFDMGKSSYSMFANS